MGRNRTALQEIELAGHTGNTNAALRRREKNPDPLDKRASLEKLFADLTDTYDVASADVAERGQILHVTKFSHSGDPYETEAINPSLRIAMKAAVQLAGLAKILGRSEKPAPKGTPIPGSAAERFPDLFVETKVPEDQLS